MDFNLWLEAGVFIFFNDLAAHEFYDWVNQSLR